VHSVRSALQQGRYASSILASAPHGSSSDKRAYDQSSTIIGGLAAGAVVGTAATSLTFCEESKSDNQATSDVSGDQGGYESTGDPEVDWACSRKPWRVVFVLGGPGAGKGT